MKWGDDKVVVQDDAGGKPVSTGVFFRSMSVKCVEKPDYWARRRGATCRNDVEARETLGLRNVDTCRLYVA